MTEVATCQLAPSGPVTTVPVRAKRNVCYEFDTKATTADLSIPYLVIVNGVVPSEHKPKKLTRDNRKIKVSVDTNSIVALYLNSDVHINHRKHPVYEVNVKNQNVFVKIKEKTGKDQASFRWWAKPNPPENLARQLQTITMRC